MKTDSLTPEQAQKLCNEMRSWPLKGIFAVGFGHNGEPFFFTDGRLQPASAAHALAIAEQILKSSFFPPFPVPAQPRQPNATAAATGEKRH